jgi:hypothetical protein
VGDEGTVRAVAENVDVVDLFDERVLHEADRQELRKPA